MDDDRPVDDVRLRWQLIQIRTPWPLIATTPCVADRDGIHRWSYGLRIRECRRCGRIEQ